MNVSSRLDADGYRLSQHGARSVNGRPRTVGDELTLTIRVEQGSRLSKMNLNCDMTVMHCSSCRYDEDSDRTRTSSHRDDRKEDRLTSSASSVHSEDAAGETRVSASRSIINTSIAQVCISSSLIL